MPGPFVDTNLDRWACMMSYVDCDRHRARTPRESPEGITLRKQRCVEVESVGGYIEQDPGLFANCIIRAKKATVPK